MVKYISLPISWLSWRQICFVLPPRVHTRPVSFLQGSDPIFVRGVFFGGARYRKFCLKLLFDNEDLSDDINMFLRGTFL